METTTACYRHPERPAGVGCQRCNRPICPECMVQASVGYQCPDCTRARPERVIPARQAFAAPEAKLTKGLVAVNFVVFLLTAATGGMMGAGSRLAREGGLFGPLVAEGEWYRLITSGFLHGGVLHLLSNMLLLWLLGSTMERAVGRVDFGLIYLTGLLGGSLGALIVTPLAFTVGASGAVFGMMAAFAVMQLMAGQNPWNSGMGGLILINVVWTFMVPGISVGGHLGGLAAGAVAGWLLAPAGRADGQPAAPRRVLVGLLCAALAVLGVLAAQRGTNQAIRDLLGAGGDLIGHQTVEVVEVAAPDEPEHRLGHE